MKITDLKEGQTIQNSFRGTGVILKLTARTITVKFPVCTTKWTLHSKHTEFDISKL